MREKKLVLQDKEYIIQEAPLRVVVGSLKDLKVLPEKLSSLDTEKENSLKLVTDLISESADEFFTIVSKVSGVDIEVISNLGVADSVALVQALLEVNDVSSIKKSIGELIGMFKDHQSKK